MSISVDCSDIITQVNQRCTVEDRCPTGEEYDFVISRLQQANVQLQQANVQLQQANVQLQQEKNALVHENETLESKCTYYLQDRENSLKLLRNEHLEVEKHKELVQQSQSEIKELKEKLSEATANLKETNSALTIENRNQSAALDEALSAKKTLKEILIKEQEKWEQEKNEYIKTILALSRQLELCQCKTAGMHNTVQESTQKRATVSSGRKFIVPTSPPASVNYRQQNLKSKPADKNKRSKVKCKSHPQSLSQLSDEVAVTTTYQYLFSQPLTDSHSTTAINTHSGIDAPTTGNGVSITKAYLDAHPTVFTTVATSSLTILNSSSPPTSVVTIPAYTLSSLAFSGNVPSSVTANSNLPARHPPVTLSTLPTNRVSSSLPAKLSSPSTADNKLHKKSSGNSGYAQCTHISSEEFNGAKISQWIASKTSPFCKKLIGDKKMCNSIENVSICVHCGVSRCDVHLHDVHDNTHCVYINMTTKEICGSVKQYDQTESENRNKKYNSPEDDGPNNRHSPVVNTTTASLSFTTPLPSHPRVVTVTTNTPLSLSSSSTQLVTTTVGSNKDSKLFGKNFTNSLLPNQPSYGKKSTKDTATSSYKTTSSFHHKTLSLPSYTNKYTYAYSSTSGISTMSTVPFNNFGNPSYSSLLSTQQTSWNSNFGISNRPFKGLVNDGLTCFSNAAIQCLSRIDQFADLQTHLFKPGDLVKVEFKKMNMHIDVTIPAEIVDHERVSEHLSATIAKIRTPPKCSHETEFNPRGLLNVIRKKYANNFRPYKQGDAHELMRCILDAVRMEEIEKVKRGIKIKYTESESGDIETLLNGEDKMLCKAALRGAHKIRTYIDQVIGGDLLSVVVCDHCKHRVELIEPFLDISLPIPEKLSYSMVSYPTLHDHMLEQCLKEYTSKDVLDNDNKFICSNCSGDNIQLRRAVKQLKLKTLPEVFIMHLKRFSVDHIVTKNSTHVIYPSEIDVGPYCAEQLHLNKTHYSLFAIIQHSGSLNCGHYTACIKVPEGQWYKADDSLVTKVEETEALNQEAYLLFYECMHM